MIFLGSPRINPSILIHSYLVCALLYTAEKVIRCVFLSTKASKFKINKFDASAIKKTTY